MDLYIEETKWYKIINECTYGIQSAIALELIKIQIKDNTKTHQYTKVNI